MKTLLTSSNFFSRCGVVFVFAGFVACGGAEPANKINSLIADSLPKFQAAKARPPASSLSLQQAKQAIARGDFASVGRFLRQEQERNPQSVELGFLLSQMMFKNAAWSAALPGFLNVLKAGPTFEGAEFAFYYYGCCSMRLGKAEIARESLLAHLELNPNHPETFLALGQLSVKNGQSSEAISFLEKAKNQALPNNTLFQAQVLLCLGEAWLQGEDLKKAKEALELSLAKNPQHSETHYTLFRVLTRLGDVKGAERERVAFEKLQ